MTDARQTTPDPSAAPDGAEAPHSGDERPSQRGGHAAGEIFAGKYEIVSLLGEGGMGTVWRAKNLLLDVHVALKVLHRDRADKDSSARLLREARATAGIGHPAIVRIFDFGESESGEPFLVMELLEGISLADWIDDNGRMTATEAVRTLLPIAAALSSAHGHGVVHRDVKPENILLAHDGPGTCLPKILDFGIAKLLNTQTGRVLTQAGAVIGSLEYMSPEQAEGKQEVGEQTDVWGLSVVLYELVTGRRPFAGTTLTAILFALLASNPTPITQLAAGDEALWAILERGLKKSPAERWPDMRSFGSALASWAMDRGITTDATGTALTHHWLMDPSERASGPGLRASGVSAVPGIAVPAPAPRMGTLETVYVGGVTAPPRRRKALFVAAGLVLSPALLMLGIYTHRGTDGATASASAFAPTAMVDAGAMEQTAVAPAVEEARVTAAQPSAVAASPVPASSSQPAKPSSPRTSSSVRPRRVGPSMPLPAAPNF